MGLATIGKFGVGGKAITVGSAGAVPGILHANAARSIIHSGKRYTLFMVSPSKFGFLLLDCDNQVELAAIISTFPIVNSKK